MFKLLSKESNIFSIPIYIVFFVVFIWGFNFFKTDFFSFDVSILTFLGLALGYFCINAVGITYQAHLPLFIYSVCLFGLYPEEVGLGISVALFINGLLVLMLSSPEEVVKRKNYLLIGFLLAINFIFFPPTWPMSIFVLLHIFATSERVGLHLFRFFFGIFLCAVAYFCVAYFLGWDSWDARYLPMPSHFILSENQKLLYLIPIVFLLMISIADHFVHYNEKSPISRYKYTFLLIFTLAQSISIFLYMQSSVEFLLLLAMPMSIFFSRFLWFRKKYWQKELFFWLIIITFLVYKIV